MDHEQGRGDDVTARYSELLQVAIGEAAAALARGALPIGAVLAGADGTVLGSGRAGGEDGTEFMAHAETAAVRAAGELDDYSRASLVTTMTPCWYCAGMVRFLGIGTVAVGDSESWSDEALEWLRDAGVVTIRLDDRSCVEMFADWASVHGDWGDLPTSVDGKPNAGSTRSH